MYYLHKQKKHVDSKVYEEPTNITKLANKWVVYKPKIKHEMNNIGKHCKICYDDLYFEISLSHLLDIALVDCVCVCLCFCLCVWWCCSCYGDCPCEVYCTNADAP